MDADAAVDRDKAICRLVRRHRLRESFKTWTRRQHTPSQLEDDCEASSAPSGRLGPANAAEAFMWPATLLQFVRSSLPQCWSSLYLIFMMHGLCLNTDYSGAGTPETVCSWLAQAMVALTGAGHAARIIVLKSGDIAEHCRSVLMSHRGGQAPQAVVGDALKRMPWEFKQMFRDVEANIGADKPAEVMAMVVATARDDREQPASHDRI